MNITLQNNNLTVVVTTKGAELSNIILNSDNVEFLWQGDPKYWGRKAPILFPIVGKVKDNTYKLDNKNYNLNQHGFARDMDFDIFFNEENKVIFKLSSNEETMKLYPFKFVLYVKYELSDNIIIISYKVKNKNEKNMFFSLGAHPGFNCPLYANENIEDYYFELDKKETASIMKLNRAGLFERNKEPFLHNENIIPLSKDLFVDDALTFSSIASSKISLKSIKNNRVINMDFTGFPYLGLWSKPEGAPFVCMEPWYGHADYHDFEEEFNNKEGIICLPIDNEFNCTYSLTFA